MNPNDSEAKKPWQTNASKVILEHPRLRVIEDDVTTHLGDEIQWLRFEGIPDFVIVLALHEAKVLLLKQYNHPLGTYLSEFPAGMIDAGESAEQAAYRELEEETGFKANKITKLGQFIASPRRSTFQGLAFLAEDITKGQLAREATELITQDWLSIAEFESYIRSSEALISGDTLAVWGLYKAHLSV